MSAEIERAVKVETGLEKTGGGGRKRTKELLPVRKTSAPLQHLQPYKKFKSQDDTRYFRSKRVYSFTGGGNAKFFPPHKKRKKVIPPTKFLLGGNIHDPLNLNSLQDEEINRAMNAVTPESSPVPTPQHRKGEVEVIIPPNIHDPLNLADCRIDPSTTPTSTHPPKRIKKKHKRKRQRSFKEDCSAAHTTDLKSDESKTEETIPETDLNNSEVVTVDEEKTPVKEQKPEVNNLEVKKEVTKPTQLDLSGCGVGVQPPTGASLGNKESAAGKKGGCNKASLGGGGGGEGRTSLGRKLESKDKIVSPVIPQPGAWAGVPSHLRFRKPNQNRPHQPTPSFNENNKRFQYGNYNRYYGYRNPGHVEDPRMKLLAQRRELFEGKDVLDIGCNTGLVTLSVAREFGARSVVGLELDRGLVDRARSALSHYSSRSSFPLSMAKLYGTIDLPGIPTSRAFPHNVSFVQGNYVLQSDVLLEVEQAQFDCILCLSVTKWIHLNWGDAGLKRAFRRIYTQLRPGGVFILEPQPWASYKRKKNLTETIWRNYQSIALFPTMFTEYLLSEVGFTKCELIGAPLHHSRGFQRPIKVFTKPFDSSPSQVSTKEERTEETSCKEVKVTQEDGVKEPSSSGVGEQSCPRDVEMKEASSSRQDEIKELSSSSEAGMKEPSSSLREDGVKDPSSSLREAGITTSKEVKEPLSSSRDVETKEPSSSSQEEMKELSSSGEARMKKPSSSLREDGLEETSSLSQAGVVTSMEAEVKEPTSSSRDVEIKEASSSRVDKIKEPSSSSEAGIKEPSLSSREAEVSSSKEAGAKEPSCSSDVETNRPLFSSRQDEVKELPSSSESGEKEPSSSLREDRLKEPSPPLGESGVSSSIEAGSREPSSSCPGESSEENRLGETGECRGENSVERSAGTKYKSENDTDETREVKLPRLGDFESETDSVGEPRPSSHNPPTSISNR